MNSILLVDDEKWVRIALKWTIEKTGLPLKVVHECANGLEAVDWLRDNEADLVLTDIRMPVMDGMSLVREIRQGSKEQDIVIISVHDEFHFVQEALREGVRDYLLKPVQVDDMKACLGKWLEQKTTAQEPEEPSIQNADLSPVQRVLKYIETAPPCEVTLAEAAKHVHMNSSYLSQLFKQEMHQNFVDYVTDFRVKQAKRLLGSTCLRISEIADRLGYSDVAYFSNIFKKHTGMTPSEYRNKTSKQ